MIRKCIAHPALWILGAALLIVGGCAKNPYTPTLLVELPEEMNTPDGMRLNTRTGDVIFSCPNFNDDKYPAILARLSRDNKVEKYCDLPVHPQTKKVGPMGLDFGPDGNLYVADNQYFTDKNYKSRLLRVNIKDHKPVSVDVVIEGFKLSNAVQWNRDRVYISDTFFDDEANSSGVYCFSLAELNKGTVKLQPKNDPHLLFTITTDEKVRGDKAGADGITFDRDGNLYTGNFGDGQFYKVSFNPNGTVNEKRLLVRDERIKCVDGIQYDQFSNRIFIADSHRNAIQAITPDGRLETVWENPDTATDKEKLEGLLDQPCEVHLRGRELLIVNMDFPVPGIKNTKYAKPHTLSVIHLP